jgi:hypothetical protein
MNSFFEAIQKGGDMWKVYMPRKASIAHCGNSVLTNGAALDDFRMRWCETPSNGDRRIVQLMP